MPRKPCSRHTPGDAEGHDGDTPTDLESPTRGLTTDDGEDGTYFQGVTAADPAADPAYGDDDGRDETDPDETGPDDDDLAGQGLTTDDGDGTEANARAQRRRMRGPKRVTAERVHNKALWYLERFASSRENLRTVLLRWALRSARHHDDDEAEVRALIDAEIERLERVQLLDDAAYAETRVRALARSGAAHRKIFMKLKEKGVDSDTVNRALETLAEETGGDSERIAAIKLARKRRLGPWRPDPETRAAKRDRDLAALARGGFNFDLALEIIDADDVEILEDEATRL